MLVHLVVRTPTTESPMLIKLRVEENTFRPSFHQEVTAVFGYSHTETDRDGTTRTTVEEVATVYRDYRLGATDASEYRVRVSWGSWGARDLATAKAFADALTEANNFAYMLERDLLNRDALDGLVDSLKQGR